MENRWFWDLHNTLETGTPHADACAFNKYLAAKNIERRYTAEQIRAAGPTWSIRLKTLVPDLLVNDQAITDLREKQIAAIPKFCKATPGAVETLRYIRSRGDVNAIVSWSRPTVLKAYMNALGFAGYVNGGVFSVYDAMDEAKRAGTSISNDTDSVPFYKARIMGRFLDDDVPIFTVGDMEGDVEAGLMLEKERVAKGKTHPVTTMLFSPDDTSQKSKANHVIKILPEVVSIVYGDILNCVPRWCYASWYYKRVSGQQ
ncbi:MAG: hypothetical protein HY362_02695 [Candidatus Aenigmarchaeota archaeon]|nr:hypothetical protein [Candidatus Aenigmarchaeota archaeon]